MNPSDPYQSLLDVLSPASRGVLGVPAAPSTAGFLSTFEQDGLTPDALAAWGRFEQMAGTPFNINSAYRDPGHNARVGGARNSQHTHGNAFDVDVSHLSESERVQLIDYARQSGFGGVGVYNNSLHFDVGPTRYWGPDYSAGSLPSWAAEAVGAPRGAFETAAGGEQPMPMQSRTSTSGQSGLLGMLTGRASTPPEDSLWSRLTGQELPGAFQNRPDFFADEDKMARLAIGLQGMTTRPNQQMMAGLQSGIDQRGEMRARDEAAQRAQAEASQARSAAIDYLVNNGADPRIIEAVGSGLMDPMQAVQASMAPTEPTTPAEFRTLEAQAAAAGLEPGTDAYRNFMLNGGVPEAGMVLSVRPDGTTTFTQGNVDGAEEVGFDPTSIDYMINSIDGILNDPALDIATGGTSWTQNIPGTGAYRFATRARQLEGQAFLRAFDSLKGAGQITEVEGAKATQAIGRLDTGQSADDYRAALNELRSILDAARQRPPGWADSQNTGSGGITTTVLPPSASDLGAAGTGLPPGVTDFRWE
jgi:hypothetical protein